MIHFRYTIPEDHHRIRDIYISTSARILVRHLHDKLNGSNDDARRASILSLLVPKYCFVGYHNDRVTADVNPGHSLPVYSSEDL
jgi:hypothetical protein